MKRRTFLKSLLASSVAAIAKPIAAVAAQAAPDTHWYSYWTKVADEWVFRYGTVDKQARTAIGTHKNYLSFGLNKDNFEAPLVFLNDPDESVVAISNLTVSERVPSESEIRDILRVSRKAMQ